MADPNGKPEIREDDSSDHQSDDLNIENVDDRNQSEAQGRKQSETAADRARRNLNAKLANPLAGMSHAALRKKGGNYVRKYQIGDAEDIRAFEIGACLAQAPERYEKVEGITEEEMATLRKEFTNRWSQPPLMYLVIVLSSTCAAVQGMGKGHLTS